MSLVVPAVRSLGALLAAAMTVGALPALAAKPTSPATPTTAAAASTAAPAAGAKTAAPASGARGKQQTVASPAAARLPGRVIIGEILTWDAEAKAMKVRNLKGEEIDLVLGAKSELQGGETLAVGLMIRTRFEERDGKNVPLFVRILKAQDVDRARQALHDPNDAMNRKAATAATAASPVAASPAPATAAPAPAK